MNEIYSNLLDIINNNRESFDNVVDLDGFNSDEIIEFLDYSINEDYLKEEIDKNIIITNGDILVILKIIHDLAFEEGTYILYINAEYISTNYYFVTMANIIYEALDINVQIKLDCSLNYQRYYEDDVILIGNEYFIREASNDFNNPSTILI